MDNFEKGDMVRLKSGGPIVIVEFINIHGDLFCAWFSTIGEYQEKAISPCLVNKVDKMDAAMEIKDINEKFDFIMLKKDK